MGPDHTGKTTLSHDLVSSGETLGRIMNLWHPGRHTGFNDYVAALHNANKNKHGTVWDRCFYDESVYRSYDHEEWQFSKGDLHYLHQMLTAIRPIVVLTTHQAKNYRNREQQVPKEAYGPLLSGYKTVLRAFGVDYIEWDWESPPMTARELLGV